MHLTRAESTKKLPIQRKGTKYIARARTHKTASVPIVIAMRDMLKLARTAREVKSMIKQKLLKINGHEVKDYRESLCLFNLLHADKTYILTITKNGRFKLEETSQKEIRSCKVLGKTLLKKGKIQINCHDGTNIITEDNTLNVHDTINLKLTGEIQATIRFEEGKHCIILKGKYQGTHGTIKDVLDRSVTIQDEKGNVIILEKEHVMVQ